MNKRNQKLHISSTFTLAIKVLLILFGLFTVSLLFWTAFKSRDVTTALVCAIILLGPGLLIFFALKIKSVYYEESTETIILKDVFSTKKIHLSELFEFDLRSGNFYRFSFHHLRSATTIPSLSSVFSGPLSFSFKEMKYVFNEKALSRNVSRFCEILISKGKKVMKHYNYPSETLK